MGLVSEWVSFEGYRDALVGLSASKVSMYHRAPWLEAVAAGFGAEIRGVHTVGTDGTSLALTPFMIKCKGPFRLLGSPLRGMYTEFAGPLFAGGLTEAEQASVVESQHRLASCSAHYIEWGAKGEAGNSWGAVLEHWGYRYTTRPSILVDLSLGEKSVWASFQGRARNMIRKAQKAGARTRTVIPTEAWIDEYYGMLRATFERQGYAVPHPHSFYHRLIGLAELGEVHCVTAEVEGRMVAGGIFLLDGSRMLYLSGTSTAEGMKTAANSLIQWSAIQEAIAAGVVDYDMGGLGVDSVDKFKRSFGGREYCHHRWIYRSRLFKLIEPAALWAARKGIFRFGGQ